MIALLPFVYVTAIVMLVGIFFNTRWLYRANLKTRFAEKASAAATIFAILSLSTPLLLLVASPAPVKIIAWGFCALNFGTALVQIVRGVQWFGRARQAERDAQTRTAGKK